MTLTVKVIRIIDATKAVQYGYSEAQIADTIGKLIKVEIPNTPYIKGEKHVVETFLPTADSLRYSQKIGKIEVQVI